MLSYFAQMNETEHVFNALLWLDDFREDLITDCSISLHSLIDFPYFDVVLDEKDDELLNALKGFSEVQNADPEAEIAQFMVL